MMKASSASQAFFRNMPMEKVPASRYSINRTVWFCKKDEVIGDKLVRLRTGTTHLSIAADNHQTTVIKHE
jgi:hypothetical protein